ncbi:MAG TPA: M23 family metallopeptidase [Gemmatimonadaceae bacterium]|nr:M23 family metallopeptidase [Gemmatimonadaceae bacterium]
MKRPAPSTVTLLVAVAASAACLAVGLPKLSTPKPLAQSAARIAAIPAVTWRQFVDTLRSGETLSALLLRGGVPNMDIVAALRSAPSLDERRVPAGMPVIIRSAASDSVPSELIFQLAVDRRLHLTRGDSGWTSREVRLPWTTDTIVVSGVIHSNLYDAVDASVGDRLPPAARAELTWSVADVYEYRVDMSRDLQDGDAFRVLVERSVGPGGVVKVGPILAARLQLSGTDLEAYRFTQDDRASYYDQKGRSLRAAFLRVPLQFRRISSVFGTRKHPILGTWRAHKGIDYAANAGTPVRAIGDGTVTYAGRRGGYGNLLEIRHPNGFVSRYGHLRGFAHGIRTGRHVSIGETVAYVGQTGLATGPHLHFEILVHGTQRDPRQALRDRAGTPIAAGSRAAFDSARALLVAQLDNPDSLRVVASR